MRLLVFGHSDSDGRKLAQPADAWPWLLGRELEAALCEPVTVDHRLSRPLKHDALQELDDTIAELQPDLVFLHLNPFAFAIQLVSLKIRQRYGPKAAERYQRWEARFDRLTANRPVLRHVNVTARRFVRRFYGVAAISSFEEVLAGYNRVMDRLAREEHLQVVVMGGSRLGGEVQALNPGMVERVDEFARRTREAALVHRFLWFNTETSMDGPDREALIQRDGVHRNEAGHVRLANMLLPLALDALRDRAAVAAR